MWFKWAQFGVLVLLSAAGSVPADQGRKSANSGEVTAVRRSFPVNELPPLTYSPKKYTFYNVETTFLEAWRSCTKVGKRLASIENLQDYEAYIKALASIEGVESIHFWIAATNLGAKPNELQQFYWITNDRPVGYLNGFENWVEGIVPNEPNQCVATFLEIASWIYGPCDTWTAAIACEESQDV